MLFLQDHFELVEVSVRSKRSLCRRKVYTQQNIQESIAISTSMDTTANSEDKKGFKFKYVSRTRVLSVVFRRYQQLGISVYKQPSYVIEKEVTIIIQNPQKNSKYPCQSEKRVLEGKCMLCEPFLFCNHLHLNAIYSFYSHSNPIIFYFRLFLSFCLFN